MTPLHLENNPDSMQLINLQGNQLRRQRGRSESVRDLGDSIIMRPLGISVVLTVATLVSLFTLFLFISCLLQRMELISQALESDLLFAEGSEFYVYMVLEYSATPAPLFKNKEAEGTWVA